ncbi:DUF3040 domain-containing protein [Pseudonocardia petroleophila]|uniref:DUF3040 domain-containing protein n=1 Tax=Pseudonocardia petroleophila TaxID=37331 RepID=A0A7G7MG97_9PSEU|nr:DUF3040 domain-containing protein [Pseudonocardia petroleophila]QNG51808.1 DUF3040 domain-containing protein [Pseudonocardia petroleophila]
MPLSEHEQRLLEQIERALYAEDPKFASTVRGGRLRKPTRRRRMQGVALFALGLVMLVVGVVIQSVSDGGGMVALIVLSVLGFVVMLGGSVLAVTSSGKAPAGAAPSAEAEPEKNGFTGRMEERFRRRFEQE